jgi:CDP-diacylglycerol--serine O-phosphatidyltransferase
MGLASPAAAAILICYVWLMQDLGVNIQSYITLTIILIVSLSILMISNIAYMSFKDVNFRQKIPYIMLFAISLAISFVSFDPPKVLFIFFLFYGLSGPGLFLFRRFKRSKLNVTDISSKDNR